MVGGQHEHHLEEAGCVVWQTAAEPEERHDTADANVVLEDVGDGHAGVEEFLATVVGDGGDEGCGLADETELLRPGVVERDLGHQWLGGWGDGARLDEILEDGVYDVGHVLKGVWDVEAGVLHGLVLHGGGLELGIGKGAGVAELHFGLQESCHGTNGPSDDGLVDPARLDGLDDAVLLDTTDLAEEDEDLCPRVVLVA